jgi:hypothetical protein
MIEKTKKLDSATISNGLSIFSQFMAHDCTFEVTSKFKGIGGKSLENHRTYQMDLDCLYGQWTQDFLYDADDRDKLLLGDRMEDDCERVWYDLQRNKQCKAIIPDARNDENIIVSRFQVLFIDLHNCMVDIARKQCQKNIFEEARRQTIWIYHWLIVHEYLKKMLDPEIFEDILANGPKYFTDPCFLPLEFTGAAFRVGHSQTRQSNRINVDTEKDLFELGVFTVMEHFVDWNYLFDMGNMKVQAAKKIDTKIQKAFHDLPFIQSSVKRERSLVWRNLKRGVIYGLPSGEDVAYRMCIEPLKIKETEDLDGTPLWYYVLKEAEELNDGEYLGPVGSRLLGEVLYGIMKSHDWSYLKVHPKWEPPLHSKEKPFDFAALLRFLYDI